MAKIDDRWSQMHGPTAKHLDKQELLKTSRATIKKTIEHSSTAPYIHRFNNQQLSAMGIEQFQEDDYNVCNWHPYEFRMNETGFSNRQKKQLKFYGWWDNSTDQLVDVWYKTNKQGFRDTHFSDAPGIACFGCSHTYGSGIHANQSWPSQLAELTGETTYNLGTPACSLETSIWYALNFLDEDLPNLTAIAVLLPPMGRTHVAMVQDDFYLVSTMRTELLEKTSSELDADTINKYIDIITSTSQINYDMHIKTLELIAKARGIPLVVTQLSEISPSDWARDMIHTGPQTQLDIAKLTMQKLGKY